MDRLKSLVIKTTCQMASSLISEGYHIIVSVGLPDTYVIKLRHHKNTNRVVLIGYYVTGEVKLFRNSKLRKVVTIV